MDSKPLEIHSYCFPFETIYDEPIITKLDIDQTIKYLHDHHCQWWCLSIRTWPKKHLYSVTKEARFEVYEIDDNDFQYIRNKLSNMDFDFSY